MGDTGSERSSAPSLPPRCPCGFWGSSKTMNLCSKCFADFQKKQPDEDTAPSTSSSQSDLFPSETDSDNGNTSIPTPTVNPTQQLPTELNVDSPSKEDYSQSEDDASPMKRPRLLDSGDRPDSSRSKQKSRRRCFRCQIKLELVQQELGSCRCGYVFCMLHRLPEQHDCTFDHMGRGREEAIMKMESIFPQQAKKISCIFSDWPQRPLTSFRRPRCVGRPMNFGVKRATIVPGFLLFLRTAYCTMMRIHWVVPTCSVKFVQS
uniref:Zinc finger AN1-type containing 3 n=1 Tax=Xenopus tropicalis TaxID=8364 RepID=A0A803K0E2_XENTR